MKLFYIPTLYETKFALRARICTTLKLALLKIGILEIRLPGDLKLYELPAKLHTHPLSESIAVVVIHRSTGLGRIYFALLSLSRHSGYYIYHLL
jgi:hypothetical protein